MLQLQAQYAHAWHVCASPVILVPGNFGSPSHTPWDEPVHQHSRKVMLLSTNGCPSQMLHLMTFGAVCLQGAVRP